MTKRDENESSTELQTLWVKKMENDLDIEICFWPNFIYATCAEQTIVAQRAQLDAT